MNRQITFIIGYLGKGGAERVIAVLCNYFAKLNYQVNLILLYENIIDFQIDSRVNVIYLGGLCGGKYKKKIYKVMILRKTLRELGNTVIISFLYRPIIVTVLANIFLKNKLIVSERNDPNNEPSGYIEKKIRNITYYFADTIVFQTGDARRYFSKRLQKKGVVIPNPLVDGLLDPYDKERKKVIVSVCRYTDQKNIPMAIDAFILFNKKYPDYKFYIYGEGELRQKLQDYVNANNMSNKILLKGFSKNIHDDIIDASMYISTSNYEGISNSMLEAMALGIPCICTDCPIGGTRYVIKNNVNGILIPVGDTDALYGSMCIIAKDSSISQRLSKEAVKIRKEFSTQNICKLWAELL